MNVRYYTLWFFLIIMKQLYVWGKKYKCFIINNFKELRNRTNNLVKVKTETSIPEKFGEHILKEMKLRLEPSSLFAFRHFP